MLVESVDLKLCSMKIALCFRGISRSLTHTISSIRDNVIAPAKEFGEVRVFTHLYDQSEIDNPRSGEKGKLDIDEYRLLNSDWLSLEPPDKCLAVYDFEFLKSFGDPWGDNFYSLRNVVHALHSLKQGWLAAQSWGPDVYLFLRPDMYYHQSFGLILQKIAKQRHCGLGVPLWEGWGGCNDTFAIANTAAAASCYAERIDRVSDYCRRTGKPLTAEVYLLDCIKEQNVPLWFMNIEASRVRSSGIFVQENFKLLRESNLSVFLHAAKTRFALNLASK
jgi:hypothetical protein